MTHRVSRLVRRAGSGRAPDGSRVTWSVAEGRRGRRWREVRVDDHGIVASLLLETLRDGRFSHLELSTAAGLLTLHPEGDGTIHGNAIEATGIRHLVGLAVDPDDPVVVAGSAIAAAAAARRLGDAIAPGTAARPRVVAIGLDLAVAPGELALARLDERRWRFGDDPALELDGDGLPLLADGGTWPLEP